MWFGNLVQWKLPKIYEGDSNEASNNDRDTQSLPTGHLLTPNETYISRTGLYPTYCWSKRSLGNLQTTQAAGKKIGCSPQTGSKVPLLKTMPTQLIEHDVVNLIPIQNLYLYLLSVFGMGKYSADQNRKINTNSDTNSLIYNLSCL